MTHWRWNCRDKRQCYLTHKHPDFGVLADCFSVPMVRPSDIDFVVELRGHFLFGEFKSAGARLHKAQGILFGRLARQPATTCFVASLENGVNPETLVAFQSFQGNEMAAGRVEDYQALRGFLIAWDTMALDNPLA